MLSNFRLREMRERRDREEAEEQARREAPKRAELTAAARDYDAATKQRYSASLKSLAMSTQQGEFFPDVCVQFPTTTEKQSGGRGRQQFEEFVHETLPKTGYVLSTSGAQRLLYYVLNQAFSSDDVLQTGSADMANPETWRIAFERLNGLRCFNEEAGELGYDESQREYVEPAPAPEPTIADVELIDTSTRAGQKLAEKVVADAIWAKGGEAAKVFQQFVAHVAKVWHYELTPEEQKAIVDWFVANNRSFLSNSYNECRVNLVRRGVLPSTLLTEDEILANSIEQEDTQSYTGRRNLLQELRAARKQN